MKNVKFINSDELHQERIRASFNRNYTLKVLLLKYLPILVLILTKKLWWVSILWWLIATVFFDHRKIFGFKPVVRVWFGVPGSGKTSMAALLSKYSRNLNYRVLSNFELKGAYKVSASDLGVCDMSFNGDGCHCILDEASSDFDNRNFKSFANSEAKNYFSFHRHQNNMVDVFSQGYDIDKRIRDRTCANGLFHLKKFFIPGFICYRQIRKILFIKKDDKQIIDGFSYLGLPRIICSRSVWSDFDTLDLSHCPKLQKDWKLWDDML
jgi:hypothetical protein